MSKPPAFQFYPKQILGDDKVLAMDWDARGMHHWLLWISWQQEPTGTLPDDDAAIRRWLGFPLDDVWRRVKPQIMAAWPVQEGRRVNAGMVRAWDRQQINIKNGIKKRENSKQFAEDEEEVISLFEKAFESYPRHVGKRAAEKAWNQAINREAKKRVAPLAEHEDFIFQRVMQYGAACKRFHKPKEFTPHMATWLNQDRFLDDPSEWEVTPSANQSPSLQERFNENERIWNELEGTVRRNGSPPSKPADEARDEKGVSRGLARGV